MDSTLEAKPPQGERDPLIRRLFCELFVAGSGFIGFPPNDPLRPRQGVKEIPWQDDPKRPVTDDSELFSAIRSQSSEEWINAPEFLV